MPNEKSGDVTPVLLSGSTDGKPIAVAATATPGTAIHTAPAGTDTTDYVWIQAVNIDTVDRSLTIEFGGTAAAQSIKTITIPPNIGLYVVCENLPIRNGNAIAAFASAANVINIVGRVTRMTP